MLIGGENTTAHSSPDIKPELQNRSVISVAIGDWHNAALTADGKVLTWGKFSSGALGLGDPAKLPPGAPGAYTNGGRGEPRSVGVPTEVRFDYELVESKDRFAFAITAAGWHTGALVIDPDVSANFLVLLLVFFIEMRFRAWATKTRRRSSAALQAQ